MWIKKQFKTTLGKVGFLSEVIPLLRAIIGCIRFVLEMAGDKEEAEKLMQALPQFVTAPWFSIVLLCFGLVLIWWNSHRSVRKKLSATEIERKQEMRRQLDGLKPAEMEVVHFLRIHGTALPSQIVTHLRGKGFEQANGVLDNLRATTTLMSTIDGMSGSVGINPAMKDLLEDISNEISAEGEDDNPAANRRSWVLAIAGIFVLILTVIGSNLLWKYFSTKAVKPNQQQAFTTTNPSAQSVTTTPAQTGTAKIKTDKPQQKKKSPKVVPAPLPTAKPETSSTVNRPPRPAINVGPGTTVVDSFIVGKVYCDKPNCRNVALANNELGGTTAGFENAGKAEGVRLYGNTIQPPPGQPAQLVKNDPGGDIKDVTASNNEIKAAIPPITVSGNCNVVQAGSYNQASANCEPPLDRQIDVPKLAEALKVKSDDNPEVEILLTEISKETTSYCSQFENAFTRAGWSAHCNKVTTSTLMYDIDPLSSQLNCIGLNSDAAVKGAKEAFTASHIQCNWVNIQAGHGTQKIVLRLLIRPNH